MSSLFCICYPTLRLVPHVTKLSIPATQLKRYMVGPFRQHTPMMPLMYRSYKVGGRIVDALSHVMCSLLQHRLRPETRQVQFSRQIDPSRPCLRACLRQQGKESAQIKEALHICSCIASFAAGMPTDLHCIQVDSTCRPKQPPQSGPHFEAEEVCLYVTSCDGHKGRESCINCYLRGGTRKVNCESTDMASPLLYDLMILSSSLLNLLESRLTVSVRQVLIRFASVQCPRAWRPF